MTIVVEILLCILIGYALGCISPSVILSKLLHRNLREEGTGNYGATNVTMVLGRGFGAFVMLFDIAKGAFSYLIASWIFTELAYAGLISGIAAMIGHCFPFYTGFKGGKGLAAYGGVVLAYDPFIFLIVITIVIILMLIVNYSFIFPYAGSFLVCVLATLKAQNLVVFAIWALMAALIMIKHFPNLKRALKSTDIGVRDYIVKHIFKKQKGAGGK